MFGDGYCGIYIASYIHDGGVSDEFLKSNRREFKIVSAHIKRSEKRSVRTWK
ncbi:hypothetical protein MNV_30020 [Candidatus Methanoperedens nitroreducens]|uniref:Uncharacterized protein n=1 Tax=Candidatus Methanoperedens nitratireducens TaxID=1392998 RepID=A0A284VQ39_9EURY|nr:hypothetical protein MNV_30020 [Candidatus Methanoperedens nitroreducens]